MARIHRLTGAESREWRMNKHLLVSKDHVVLRDATKDEIAVNLPVMDDSGVEYSLVRAREHMIGHFWRTLGAVQLRRSNGTIIAIVRDPSKPRTKEVTRKCPPPASCGCRQWAGAMSGKHHEVCSNNALAPQDEQHPQWRIRKQAAERIFVSKDVADQAKELGDAPMVESSPDRHHQDSLELPPGAELPLTAPEGCQCQSWDGTKPGRHNNICSFKEAWEEANMGADGSDEEVAESLSELVLYSTSKKRVLRVASDDEISESQALDVPLITVDDEVYLVIARQESWDSEKDEEDTANRDASQLSEDPATQVAS